MTCCCSNFSVQVSEGEEDSKGVGVMASIGETLTNAAAAVADKIEEAVEVVEEAVDAMRDKVVDSLGLDEKFKTLADRALDHTAPLAGEQVITDALEGGFIPGFKTLDDMTSKDLDSEAKNACANKILSFKPRIHDFCEDVVEFMKEGNQIVGAALKCLHKVVSWILRACKEGVQLAVQMIKKVIPDCCEPCCLNCMGLGEKMAEFIATTFNKLVDMVENLIKEYMGDLGFPAFITDKVEFNGEDDNPDNARDDDLTEKEKIAKNKGQEAPQQETMGE